MEQDIPNTISFLDAIVSFGIGGFLGWVTGKIYKRFIYNNDSPKDKKK